MNRHPLNHTRLNLEALEDRSLPSASALAVASAITHSFEADAHYAQTDYANILHRAPPPAELTGWAVQEMSGLRTDVLEAIFANSPGYHASHGGDGIFWVNGLYRDVLGRAPSAMELTGWMSAMQHGVSPAQVAL